MRYLLLSVLVVCFIGVMVPSAFGQVGPNYDPGSYVFTIFDLGLIILIVVPVALVIIIVMLRKIMRKMK